MTEHISDRPPVGTVRDDGSGPQTTCYACGSVVSIWSNGLMMPHHKPRGEGPCRVKWAAPDLESAIARDEKLNPEEGAAQSKVFRWLWSCTGFDAMYGRDCYHPGCAEWRDNPPAHLLLLRALRILRSPHSAEARHFNAKSPLA